MMMTGKQIKQVEFTYGEFEALVQLIKDDFDNEYDFEKTASRPTAKYMKQDLALLKACFRANLNYDVVDYKMEVIEKQWESKIQEIEEL